MCAQKMFLTTGVCMEQWCWHAVQRRPSIAAALLKNTVFFSLLLALWASDKGCSELGAHRLKISLVNFGREIENRLRNRRCDRKGKRRATKCEQLLGEGKDASTLQKTIMLICANNPCSTTEIKSTELKSTRCDS